MVQEGAHLVRGRLINAGQPNMLQISLPYEEVIRVALLAGYYEKAWEEDQIGDALNWWRALPEALPSSGGWAFTLRDLEPAWIDEKPNGDFTTVYVSTDLDGRMMYEVMASRGGDEAAAHCRDITALKNTLAELSK